MKITMKKDKGLMKLDLLMIGDVFMIPESGFVYIKMDHNRDTNKSKCFGLGEKPIMIEYSNEMLVREVKAELFITPVY